MRETRQCLEHASDVLHTSVVVIGAGPAGLNVAIRLHEAGVPTTVIERGEVAATIRDWPPGTRMFSAQKRVAVGGQAFPGHLASRDRLTREEYLQYLEDVTKVSGVPMLTHHEVGPIHRDGARFTVTTRAVGDTAARKVNCQYVVIANGCMHAPLQLGVEGEELPFVRTLPKLDFAASSPTSVCVVGGRHSAVEASLRYSDAGARVTLVYRRAELNQQAIKTWLYEEVGERIDRGTIVLRGSTEVTGFEPGGVVRLRSIESGAPSQLQCDLALVACGFTYSTQLLDSVGVQVSGRIPQVNLQTMESNISNLFVAGTAAAGPQQSGYTHDIDNIAGHAVTVVDEIIRRLKEHDQ